MILKIILIFLCAYFFLHFLLINKKQRFVKVTGDERNLMEKNVIYMYFKNPLEDENGVNIEVVEDFDKNNIVNNFYVLKNMKTILIEDLNIITNYLQTITDKKKVSLHYSVTKELNISDFDENARFTQILQTLPYDLSSLVELDYAQSVSKFTVNTTDKSIIGNIQFSENSLLETKTIKLLKVQKLNVDKKYLTNTTLFVIIGELNYVVKNIKYTTTGEIEAIAVLNNTSEKVIIDKNSIYDISDSPTKNLILNQFLFDQTLKENEIVITVNGKTLSLTSTDFDKNTLDYRGEYNTLAPNVYFNTHEYKGCYVKGSTQDMLIMSPWVKYVGKGMSVSQCKYATEGDSDYFFVTNSVAPTTDMLYSTTNFLKPKFMYKTWPVSTEKSNVCYSIPKIASDPNQLYQPDLNNKTRNYGVDVDNYLLTGAYGNTLSTDTTKCNINNPEYNLVYKKITLQKPVQVLEIPPYKNLRRQKIYSFLFSSLF